MLQAMKVVAIVGLVLGAMIGGSSQSVAETAGPPPTAVDAPDEPIQQVCTSGYWYCGPSSTAYYWASSSSCFEQCGEFYTVPQAANQCDDNCTAGCSNHIFGACN